VIQLKGMTWNHERGIAPLEAASRKFHEANPDIAIAWDARSLHDFERYPLELLADRYDLIMIDHPHLGVAVAQQLLLPLDGLLPQPFLEDQRSNSVGLSYASYQFAGKQWALAVDAAAQITAYREDLLAQAEQGQEPSAPATWDETLRMAQSLPPGLSIGIPLVPVHAYSSFFTLCAQLGGTAFWSEERDVPLQVGEEALALLENLAAIAHPKSFELDPIGMYELMCGTNEVAYVPLIYGYSNYARRGFSANRVRCGNIPAANAVPSGSMIGGVGLAISARCKHVQAAADFARLAAGGEYQKTGFFEHGGQPGHLSAWTDPQVNARCNGFFSETLRTLELGSMRPRFAGYIGFQEEAGAAIRQHLIERTGSRAALVDRLNRLIRDAKIRSSHKEPQP